MRCKHINQQGFIKMILSPFRAGARGGFPGIKLALFVFAATLLPQTIFAGNLYWDINGATAGAGGPSPSGTWDTSSTDWTTSSAGTAVTTTWTDGNTAVFSAGTDATGSYTITLSGTQTPGAVTFADGAATLSGGTLTLGGGGVVTVNASPVKGIISSVISGSVGLTKVNSGELVLTAANIFSGNLTNQGGTLTLNNSSAASSGSIVFNPLGANTAVLTSSNASMSIGNSISLTGGLSATVEIDPATNNILVLSGVLSGAHNWAANGLGTIKLSGSAANTFTGVLSVKQGTVVVAAPGALSPGNNNGTVVNSGATLALDGGVSTETEPLTLNGAGVGNIGALQSLTGQNSFGGQITFNSDATIGALGTSTLVLAAPVANSSTANLTITNPGTVALEGSSYSYSNTLVAAGTLEVDSPANAGNGLVTVAAGASLTGNGSAPGGITVSGTIAPLGTFSSGSQTWQGGGKYIWEIADATDPAVNDLLSISTNLVNNATAGNKFTISIVSLDPNTFLPGTVGDFDNTQQYDWTIATTATGITGVDPTKFIIDASAFTSSLGGGSFHLLVSGNNLVIEFDPAPVINCPNPVVQGNDLNDCSGTVIFAATATNYPDLRPVTIVYQTNGVPITSPWVFPYGTTTVNATATDSVGDTATCSFTVTINDTQPPTVAANPITVDLDGSGHYTLSMLDAASITAGSFDNCGIASTNLSPTSFSCANVGPNTVTVVMTDIHGNLATNHATVTVKDLIPPTVVVNPITVFYDASGHYTLTPSDISSLSSGSSDACGIASRTVNPSTFTTANVGANTVTVTVTDVNGNSASNTTTVTLKDNVPPAETLNPITITLGTNGMYTLSPSDDAALTAGSTDAFPITSILVTPDSFNCGNVGPNTVSVKITDNQGNSSTGSTTVTVQDTTPPVIVFSNITVQLDNTGTYTLTAADIANITAGSYDACGIASTNLSRYTFGYCDVGTNHSAVLPLTVTLTDVNSNVANTNGTITVLAPAALPMVVYVDANYTGSCAQVTFPLHGGTGTNYIGYSAFPTIQAALNAVAVGGTVNVAAGLFSENVTMSKSAVVQGAGSGSDPSLNTVVTSVAVNTPIITITSGGASATNPLVIANLRVEGATGNSEVSASGIQLAAPGSQLCVQQSGYDQQCRRWTCAKPRQWRQ